MHTKKSRLKRSKGEGRGYTGRNVYTKGKQSKSRILGSTDTEAHLTESRYNTYAAMAPPAPPLVFML
jgi:hypothetical protein